MRDKDFVCFTPLDAMPAVYILIVLPCHCSKRGPVHQLHFDLLPHAGYSVPYEKVGLE